MAKIIGEQYIEGNLSSICENNVGQQFYLATEKVTLSNGDKTAIYFWLAKNQVLKSGQKACTVPSGFMLAEMEKGFPVLKRS